MTGSKKEYDLVCSLGGNCSAAHNLRYRNMRLYSLPFDWCYLKSEKPIEYLSEGFKNNFENFALKENLEEINYSQEHKDKVQYFDKYTEYYLLNHFNRPITEKGSYEEFNSKLRRRIDRLNNKIKTGKKILFILSSSTEINTACVETLQETLKSIYPDKQFDFVLIYFSCSQDETYTINENITVYKYKRPQNQYDFIMTNFEWAFLDSIKVKNNNNNIIEIKKIKKTYCIYVLPKISTLFRIELYLLGFRLDICLGKIRNKGR